MGILVDSNVILDVFEDDPTWSDWSISKLESLAYDYHLYINPIIYSEVSIGFKKIEELEEALSGCGFRMVMIPKEAFFLAGKVFFEYRRRKGIKTTPLPDFFIGAHAAVSNLKLLTRDVSRYRSYYPTVNLIYPE